MVPRAACLVFASSLLFPLAGCQRADASSGEPIFHDIAITTADFHFRAPRTAPAGLARITLHNSGPHEHHVQLVKLAAGHSVAEYIARLQAREFHVPWATFIGGPESPGVGATTATFLQLTPGEYAMICLISGADHIPHFAKGMILPLTVTAADKKAAPLPSADVRIALRDNSFDVAPAITPGRHSILVENIGSQPHHVALVRLGAGRTAEDYLTWVRDMREPPLDHPVGGTTAIAPGGANVISADFVPGDYALICFVPDTRDGVSHMRHGMVRQFRVAG